MIKDEEYLNAVKIKLAYEKERADKHSAIYLLPSHAKLTKKALELYEREDDESKINIELHKAYIAGGVWMLEECKKALEKNGEQSTL